jgi:hypothetical protein
MESRGFWQSARGSIMGIRFYCPLGHKLNVKEFQAGRRGICPFCGEKILIPTQSSRPSSHEERLARRAGAMALATAVSSSISTVPPPADHPDSYPLAPVAETLEPAPVQDPDIPGNVAVVADHAENAAANGAPGSESSNAPPAAGVFTEEPAQTPDALNAANVIWYVRPPTGGQFGPATTEILRNWLAEGRISTDTLVWREGWRDWLEAGGVFPQLKLTFADLQEALEQPAPLAAASPRLAAPSRDAGAPAPKKIVWLIVGLGISTLLAIIGVACILATSH